MRPTSQMPRSRVTRMGRTIENSTTALPLRRRVGGTRIITLVLSRWKKRTAPAELRPGARVIKRTNHRTQMQNTNARNAGFDGYSDECCRLRLSAKSQAAEADHVCFGFFTYLSSQATQRASSPSRWAHAPRRDTCKAPPAAHAAANTKRRVRSEKVVRRNDFGGKPKALEWKARTPSACR